MPPDRNETLTQWPGGAVKLMLCGTGQYPVMNGKKFPSFRSCWCATACWEIKDKRVGIEYLQGFTSGTQSTATWNSKREFQSLFQPALPLGMRQPLVQGRWLLELVLVPCCYPREWSLSGLLTQAQWWYCKWFPEIADLRLTNIWWSQNGHSVPEKWKSILAHSSTYRKMFMHFIADVSQKGQYMGKDLISSSY